MTILNSKHIIPVGVLIAAAALLSCSHLPPPPAGGEYVELAQPWHPGGIVEFSPEPYDSLAPRKHPYTLILSLRYMRNSPHKEIKLALEEMSLEADEISTDTLTFALFSSHDLPLGKGSYNVFEISDTIHSNFPLPEGYTLSVEPLDIFSGIISIGYRLM